MSIEQLLDGKSLTEKAKVKAEELSKIALSSFKEKDFEITIKEKSYEKDMLKLVLEVKQGEKVVLSEKDNANPFYFKNPPIKVPTGNKISTKIGDKEYSLDEFEENADKAVKKIILDVLKTIKKI